MTYDEAISLIMRSDPKADWKMVHYKKGYIAIFHADINLRIEQPDDKTTLSDDEYLEEWMLPVQNFKTQSYYSHIYYGSTLLQSVILVYLEERQIAVPRPIGRIQLEPLEHCVAEIFDYASRLPEYYSRLGLTKP